MKICVPIFQKRDYEFAKIIKAQEVIVGHLELSRQYIFGTSSLKKMIEDIDLPIFLQWDILMTGESYKRAISLFESLSLDKIKGVRVRDPGAMRYLNDYYPELELHLILDEGNHNKIGLHKWASLFKNCRRLIISSQLTKKFIKDFCRDIDKDIEILGFGRIPLFYSPRKLLNADIDEFDYDHLEALGHSEESAHKGFPLVQNRHGTFMYNTKDLSLLSEWEQAFEVGIDYIRIEPPKELDDLGSLGIAVLKRDTETLKKLMPRPLVKGFFNVNKTQVLFPKLKNYRLLPKGDSYIGDVLDVQKNSLLAIKLRRPSRKIQIGDDLKIMTPDGKIKMLKIHCLKDTAGKNHLEMGHDSIVILPHVGGVSIRSRVYFSTRE